MERMLERDFNYIDNEIIAQQTNGKYCKWSSMADTVSAMNFTKEDYLNFWLRNIASRVFGRKFIITNEVVNKLKERIEKMFERTIPLDEMIKKEENSKDSPKEKKRILKEITRK